jgi:phytoene desaturase
MSQPTAVIIGAGIGGLTTAAHLARRGIHVTVIEKNQRPGGRCDHFTREGHRFDTGPTLLIMPDVYEAEFAALGVNLHDALDLQRVDPTYHLVFDDGRQLALTSDMKSMCAQLEDFEPGSFQGFLRYMAEGQRHYDLAMKSLINRDFRRASEFFNIRNLPLLYQIKPLLPHYRHMNAYFHEPRLKAAFTFQDVYMGMSPFEAAATFSMMPYTELAHGVWYPRGGMNQVVEVMMDVTRKAGVEFVFETCVDRIEVNGKRATGVLLEGNQRLDADIVVANADLPYVYKHLLPDDDHAKQMERKKFSCSVISFFWGVDKAYPNLPPHTLFLADHYRENFEQISRSLPLPDNPSLYIHAPARLDPTAAPPGQDTIIAIVPIGHMKEERGENWREIRDGARQAVFKRLALLGITDLESHLKLETNFMPPSWHERYNLMKGATHGLSHTLMQLGYMRPHNRHARYHNLYFVGASTHPGTGVPTALISGHLTANRVIDEQRTIML